MKFSSGIECTLIYGSGKDILYQTQHIAKYRQDFTLAREHGLTELRYPAAWHRIEAEPGQYDWEFQDQMMLALREHEIEIIADPLHHTSYPEWLTGGFADERFVSAFTQFVNAFAERYPWVNRYAVVNEPYVTTQFCGELGIWHPCKRNPRLWMRMVENVSRAIVLASQSLIGMNPQVELIHVDVCEGHRALTEEAQAMVTLKNQLRFLIQDLVQGKVNQQHPLTGWLTTTGLRDLGWFLDHPTRIDVVGCDFYRHTQWAWSNGVQPVLDPCPRPMADLMGDYLDHFQLPLMLAETNIRGTIFDRISWLKYTVEQAEILEQRLNAQQLCFRGYSWYPWIDSADWDNLVTTAKGNLDPQGIIYLDADCNRHCSQLSDLYRDLTLGKIGACQIPAYRFLPPVDTHLSMFMPQMTHWEWQGAPL